MDQFVSKLHFWMLSLIPLRYWWSLFRNHIPSSLLDDLRTPQATKTDTELCPTSIWLQDSQALMKFPIAPCPLNFSACNWFSLGFHDVVTSQEKNDSYSFVEIDEKVILVCLSGKFVVKNFSEINRAYVSFVTVWNVTLFRVCIIIGQHYIWILRFYHLK